MSSNELLDQHAIRGDHGRAYCVRYQSREGQGARQTIHLAHGCLLQRILTQDVVVVQILVVAARSVQSLGNEIAQGKRDALRRARILECRRNPVQQADLAIQLSRQRAPPSALRAPPPKVASISRRPTRSNTIC